MKNRPSLFWLTLAVSLAVPVAAVQVWFSSAPSGNVGNGASYYVEATAYAGSWWEWNDLWLYKNGSYVAGNGGSGYFSAGTWQSDGGPQTIEYFAEAWDWGIGENAVDWRYVTVDPPANQAPFGVRDYYQNSVPRGANLYSDGWAADYEMGAPIARVDVLIDGSDVGDAALGNSRPDVANAYGRSDFTYSGWYFYYNTAGLGAGSHSIEFRAWDNQGASATFGYATFTVTNASPSITLLSPAAQTVNLGTTLTLSSRATDPDGNITNHNLDIQKPDGSWNWQGGFANGEPYNGGPVGSAADSTRTANFAFNQLGTWYVRSWVNDASGNSLHSATVAIVVADLAAPSAPTGLNATGVSYDSFTLNWAAATDNVGVTRYEVMRDSIQHGYTTGLNMGFGGLTANTTYAMKVRAGDAAGNWSGWSTLNVTTATILTAPTNLAVASKGSAFMTLSWTAGNIGGGAPGYRVYRDGVLIATVATTYFSDWGLSPETTYAYSVKTLNGSNQESAAATLPSSQTKTLAATLSVFTPLAQ
jgi:chitodextrinase